jgi:hypothetical protein
MRNSRLVLIAPFVLSFALPASAQVTGTPLPSHLDEVIRSVRAAEVTLSPNALKARPELVVARLMSFDQNHDGRLTRAELPERMQTLLAVGDVTQDEALDAAEVRSLAERPEPQVPLRGFEPGRYGVVGGDSGIEFDSSLHIRGAIEDLRLAAGTRDKALSIGNRFADALDAQSKTEVLNAARAVLTPEQLVGFKAALEREVFVRINTDDAVHVQALHSALSREVRRVTLMRLVAQYPLGQNEKGQLQAALDRFKAHDHMTDADRSALLAQLRGVISDRESEDLRAALERRPIVKQDGVTAGIFARGPLE